MKINSITRNGKNILIEMDDTNSYRFDIDTFKMDDLKNTLVNVASKIVINDAREAKLQTLKKDYEGKEV